MYTCFSQCPVQQSYSANEFSVKLLVVQDVYLSYGLSVTQTIENIAQVLNASRASVPSLSSHLTVVSWPLAGLPRLASSTTSFCPVANDFGFMALPQRTVPLSSASLRGVIQWTLWKVLLGGISPLQGVCLMDGNELV